MLKQEIKMINKIKFQYKKCIFGVNFDYLINVVNFLEFFIIHFQ